MSGLRPVLDLIRRPVLQFKVGYYRLALREIDPLHPDVPQIVLRLNELESQHVSR